MRAQELSGCHPWWIVDSASSVGGLGRHKKKKKKTLKRRVFVVGVIFAVLQLLSNKVSGVEALGNHRNHHQLHRTNSNSELDDDLNLDDSEVVRFLSHPVHQSSHDADSFSSNHANRIRRQDTFYEDYSSGDYEFETPGDDEDYVDRGSGFVESDISVRILIIIEEPWNKFLLDVNSSAHRQLARRIQGGFDGYYGDIEGNQMVQVRRFAPTTRSEILAILDMVISENPNVNESKDILEQRLREGRIGDLAIVEGGPSWWRLMDSPGFSSSECTSFEVFCPSGECVGADRICDGIRDCLDASDELKCSEQCNFDQHECDYGHCIEKKLICDGKVDCPSDNSDERNCPNANIIPSPSPQPVGCRADTQIACPGSNTRICEIHKCDGNEDCPKDPLSTSKSWDEVDCPDYSNITFETPTEEEQKLTFFVTVTPKLQIVPVGSTITLDCSVEPNDFLGTRVPSLDWNREEDSMPLNRITLGPLGTSMQISNIKKSDAGTYTCSGMATLNEVLVKKSDESVLQIKLCESDEFSCETGECLRNYERCNYVKDCPGGEDELNCPCRSPDLLCGDGSTCIESGKVCDGFRDCPTGEDESSCEPECDGFVCQSDSKCIPSYQVCDYILDCDDKSDEINCACDMTTQFPCDPTNPPGGKCLPLDMKCDSYPDCPDGRDEDNCPITTCRPDQFTCESNPFDGAICISIDLQCNGQSDCYNGEDERGCSTPTCPPDQFTCDSNPFSDTLCISMDLRCNGQSDCYNGEDEQGCPTPTCPPDQFTCDSNSFSDTLCISMDLKCDGKSDCDSGEDEKDCPLVCPANEVKCLDAEICAIPCNNFMECPMGEDELNCQITTTPLPPTPPPTPACRPNEFECRDGSCISVDLVCNLEYDCVDGSDEDPNKCACDPPNFQCTSGRCLDQSRVCDSINDCDDGVDEFNCIEECQSGQFQCGNGLCVDGSKICDGIYDCVDAADERDCALCRPYEFRCESGDCVDSRLRCNGFVDCTDGTDELDCPFGCSTSEFQCSSGRPQCIDNRRKCDSFRDCQDGSDEENCGCRDYEFQCRSGQCVEASRKCDRYSDCQDGSDEIDCGCQDYEFQCRSGQCIEGSRKCDRYSDCQDGSDEDGCPVYCRLGEFTCANGQQCILERYRCNDRYDCNDGSDEQGCQPTETLNLRTYPTEQTIKEGREVVFQCRDESPLRARVQWTRGNGLAFPPGSRDANGRLEMPNIQITHTGTYVCEAIDYVGQYGSTISVYLRVIEQERPPALPSRTCGPAEATCANGDCVLKSLVCDGNFDCADGSDERNCRGGDGCEPNEFQCDNKRCVLKTWRCDSDDDCGDQSDETFCATNPPGSPCKYHEWMCQSGDQCIPKSFHCDSEMDCQDQSDEIGCTPPIIIESPPPQVIVDPSFTFVINCTAMGIPTPEIVWRLNWGHVPDKCSMTSTPEGGNRAYGELTCPDAMEMDQGAYSCEAINSKGSCFAGSPGCGQPGQDAIVLLRRPDGICSPGKFNTNAMSEGECLSCFCFGITEECSSAELYLTETRIPNNGYILVGVSVNPSGVPSIETNIQGRDLLKSTRAGQIAFSQDTRSFGSNTPFFKLPIDGNQLKSYGAYLSLNLRYSGNGDPTQAPTIILIGNDLTLMYIVPSNELKANEANSLKIRFWEGLWYKRAYPNGQGVQGGEPATRNEIMMALQNVQHLLVKGQYLSDIVDTTIESLQLGSAENQDQGLGPATLVEQCRCPKGYMGLSCEECAPDYERVQEGPWKGMCRQPVASCPPGYYGDPSSGIECQVCPCPLQSPSNQFGRECYLDFDKEVTCRCPMGYEGRRCDQCAPGYSGNPTLPGDFCKPGPSQSCNYPGGSYAPTPDPNTGRCQCQPGYVGNFCERYDPSGQFPPPSQPSTSLCQEDEFRSLEENSCINCFCMGIPQTNGQPTQCQGSNLYRDKERAVFSDDDSLGFVLSTEFPDEPPITDVFVDLDSNELVYQPTTREKLFWKLPAQFIGNKLVSYGGILQFHLGNTPEISQESILEAPLVEIQGNDIRLLHYTNAPVGPNDPFVVKFIENQWQRQDGQRTGREHLLMALANLDHILIRATFGEGLEDIRIGNVTMDVAGGRDTGLQRASSVEQCLCPPGYKGLSCEKCSPGYTRSTEGLYLGLCQPCQCYGYANTCDPDNGVCVGCRDGTTGAYCDRCEEGYDGDPTRGIPCTRSSEGPLTCSCDSRGSLSQECDNYQCDCKANVEGTNCNRCKSGTFDLDASNPIGCSECWCAGVTDECFEAPLYWSTLRMIPTDSQHGVTLKDMSRRENFSRNLQYGNGVIGYQYASKSDQPLYWSLPAQFIGNKVESYGGNLTIHQKFGGNGAPLDLANVIMVGNGVALHWKDPNQSRWTPDEKMETVLNLREPDWIRVQGGVPSEATKDDFLTALSNLDVILIRATLLEYTSSTSLHKVMMDIAVQQATGFPSNGIEECQCPVGYQGNSCQECAVGHYRDPSNRSEGSLGKCKPCQCNGNEQECSLDIDGILQCTCQPGYSGPRCESVDEQARPPYQPYPSQPTRPPYQQPPTRPPYQPPTRPPYQPPTRPPYQPPETTRPPYRPPQNTPPIEVTITGPKIQIIEVGQTIQFQCNANNRFQNTPVDISWSKADGSLPYGRYNDNQRGLLVITGIQVSDQGTYVCTATDGVYTMTDETVLTVDGNNGPPPGKPTVRTEPRYIYSNEGESAQFICIAEGNPIPSISWKPGRGSLNNAEVRGQTLSFNRVQKSDEGDYFCVASNDYGETEERVFLYVEEREYISPSIPTLPPPPQPQPRPPYGTPPIQISPQSYSGNPGETIRLDCRASQPGYSISWSKQEGRLPYSATQENGVLIIPNPSVSDSGVYICMASNQSGVRQESQAVITIQAYPSEPIPYNPNEPQQELRIAPEQQTVPQGTIATLRCNGARGNIVWTKVPDEDLSQNPNVQISGNTLTIRNPQVSDRGVYVCTVTGPNGMDRSSAILEIERRESPQIEIYPQPAQRINTGQSVLFQCRVMAGIPMPTLTWSRSDGRQMQPNVEVLEGGVLRIMNVVGPERGEYKCLAENLAGRVERIATLVIQEPPEITMNPDNSIQINVGDQKRITCTAKGNPLPRITWEKINQGPIQAPTSPTSSDTVSSTYMIPRASREDQGSYLCKAVSEAGEAQGMVQLIVLKVGVPAGPYQPQPEYGRPGYGRPEERPDYGRPEERPDYGRPEERPDYGRPDERPDYGRPDYNQEGGRPDYGQQGGVEVSQKQFDAPLGGNAELRCFVVGNMAGIQAQWIRPNNQRLPSGSYERGGTLYLRDLMREDGGQYTCQAVDPSGRVLFRATTNLQVTAPPRIILDPAKQVVNPGDDARIACVATGDQPINIRWTKQNGELPQSVMVQGGIMEFRGISPSDQGKYACSASNMVGRAEAVAEVIVQDDLVRITWLEAVLYSPEGNIINDPLYTFNFDDESGRESGSGSKADNDEGSGEMDDWDHGNRGGGAQQGSPEYEDLEPERDYPPVEPYESKERYIGVKATEDNEYSYQVGDQFSAREGSSIDLRCRLDTSNGRYLQWSKENGYIPRQAMEMQDGILRIPNVMPSDSGRYICSNGQDRQYVFLTIDSYQGGGGTGGNSGGGGGGGGSNTNDDSILDPRFGDFPSYPGYPGYPEDRGSSGPYAEPSRGDSGDPYDDDEAYASYPGYGSPSTDPQALTRPKVQCTENEFHCLEREECINIAHVCDGEIDCTDGSDEKNCRNRRSAFTQAEVEIQSNRKKVFEGDDLELRCSLIGDSTGVFGRISWTKLNSYLSSNVQDMGSVLRFTKLQEDNTGVYQCTIYTSQGNIFKQNFELNVEGWNFF